MTDWSDIVQGDCTELDESKLCFETISVKKVVWLSILTLGIYEIVWFYKSWKTLAVKFGYKVSPFWRALFAGITGFWLFPVMDRYIRKFNVESFNAALFAVLYLVLNILYKLPDPWWLVCFASVAVIAVIQDKINKVNEENFPDAPINKWRGVNTFWSIIGGMMLLLALIGTFLPE